jgi:peroxiredoxin Q/BCP
VGKQYGILGPVGFYRRSIVVVDASGIVRYVHRAVAGLSFRPTDEVVAAVAAAR